MYHRWIIVPLMLFSTASFGEGTVNCNCKTTQPVDGAHWSKCLLQEKEENIGCYSGWMTRSGRCVASDSSTNIKTDLCLEKKRCLLNRQCEGSWGQWAINGYKCDCETNKQVQSRYCYEHSQSSTLSYHCRGSKGKLEQTRQIPCTPRSCSKAKITYKSSTTTTTKEETTAPITSEDTTQYEQTSTTVRTRTRQEEAPTTFSLQTTIVAAAVGAVAVIAILLLFVVLLSRRKKRDEDENKNQPASNGIQPHHVDDRGFEGAVPNTIYIPYSDNGDNEHYNTFDHDSRLQTRKNGVVVRSATTRPPQNVLRPLPDPQRERSVTVGRPSQIGMYHDTHFSGSGLALSGDSSNGAYEQPLLRGTESELYWSIDETIDRLNTRT